MIELKCSFLSTVVVTEWNAETMTKFYATFLHSPQYVEHSWPELRSYIIWMSLIKIVWPKQSLIQ